MCVGIYTHYAHCDQAYYAVRLAELFRIVGVPFDIYSDILPARLQLSHDRAVRSREQLTFTDWVKKQQVVIWTHIPRVEQINYCQRRGIKTVLVPMWQDMVSPFRKSLRRADAVIALSSEAKELYTAVYKLKNVVYIPFDTGAPITRKDTPVTARNIRLFLPLSLIHI